MSALSKFPLLNLPLVACIVVVKQMQLGKQYHLAYLSTRAENLVRISNRKTENSIALDLSDVSEIQLEQPINEYPNDTFLFRIVSRGKNTTSTRGFICETDDIRHTLKKQLKRVIYVFRPITVLIRISQNVPFDFVAFLFREISELKIEVTQLKMWFSEMNKELFNFVLESSKDVVKTIYFNGRKSDGIWWELQTKEPLNFKCCIFRSFKFANTENFISRIMNCERVLLINCDGMKTVEHLSMFVKSWVKNSKLQYVRVNKIGSLDNLSSVVDGVQNSPASEAYYVFELEKFEAGQAFKIQQEEGGQEAVVFICDGSFVLTTSFATKEPAAERFVTSYC